jgi:chorismate mutase
MQKMNPNERKTYLEKKSRERTELQAKISQLNSEREKYVAAQMKSQSGTNTLDSAIIGAIREQGQKRSLKFQ